MLSNLHVDELKPSGLCVQIINSRQFISGALFEEKKKGKKALYKASLFEWKTWEKFFFLSFLPFKDYCTMNIIFGKRTMFQY